MTAEQFDSHAWRKGDKVIYNDKEYDVIGVDFNDKDIYIRHSYGIHEWVSYAVVEIIDTEEI
jgi:hypothetical protein